MDIEKSAQNACELLLNWSGDTVVPYREFNDVMNRAYNLNIQIARGDLVVISKDDYEQLLSNQKKRR